MNSFVKAGRRFGLARPALASGAEPGPLAGGCRLPRERLAPMRISEPRGRIEARAIILPEPALAAPWHVACAQPMREGHAEAELSAAGFVAYCPREIRLAGDGARRREAERPFLPRYLFIAPLPGQGEALACRSVHSVLAHGDGRWARVSGAVVRMIAERESAGDLHLIERMRRRAKQARKGDSVSIISGPLAGWTATVIAAEPGKRLKLLVNMMGGSVQASADVDRVEILGQR